MAEKPARLLQFIAAIGACLGGFALGNVIGWSSPAISLIEKKYNASTTEISWIVSSMTLGAAATQITAAIFVELIGPKWTMIATAIPLIAGWLVMAFETAVFYFYIGRVLTGFGAATYCVASPIYIGEFSDKDIRGTLSVMFQFLLVIGILVTFCLGEIKNMFFITIPHCAIPAALILILIFLPESPMYLYKKGKIEKARHALQRFRGKKYDIEDEIKSIDVYTSTGSDESFWAVLKKKANLNGFAQLLTLHVLQQLSGINAVMFYAFTIFNMAGGDLSEGISTIILGIVQLVMTAISVYAVDRAGRKLLWLVSLGVMCVCLVVLGIYFFLQSGSPETAKKITFIPIIAICLYICGFSLGGGPLPWAMIGEMLPSRIKGPTAAFIAFTNWILAFAVSSTFPLFLDILGAGTIYWIFAGVCGLGIPFVIFVLIETKGKDLDEIQAILSGKNQ